MKKTFVMTLLLILCLAACSNEKRSDEVIPVNNKDNSITTFGIIKCHNTMSISVPFNTSIIRILKGEGDEVSKGQSLIEFDLTDYNLQIDKKQREIDNLKQQLESRELKLKTLQDQTKIKIDELNQNLIILNKKFSIANSYIKTGLSPEIRKLALALETSEKELKVAKVDLSDCKELYDAGAVSLKEYEQEQRNFEAKDQKIKEIKLEMDVLKQKYISEADTLAISINQNKNDIEKIEVDMSNQEIELKALIQSDKKLIVSTEAEMQHLRSSIDDVFIKDGSLVCDVNRGALDSIRFNPGDTIAAGSIITNLLDLDSLYVEVGIEEQSISQVHMGSEVQIIPEMDKTKFYTGKVSFISSVASVKNDETIIYIKVSIDKPDKILIPNANVKIRIL